MRYHGSFELFSLKIIQIVILDFKEDYTVSYTGLESSESLELHSFLGLLNFVVCLCREF